MCGILSIASDHAVYLRHHTLSSSSSGSQRDVAIKTWMRAVKRDIVQQVELAFAAGCVNVVAVGLTLSCEPEAAAAQCLTSAPNARCVGR